MEKATTKTPQFYLRFWESYLKLFIDLNYYFKWTLQLQTIWSKKKKQTFFIKCKLLIYKQINSIQLQQLVLKSITNDLINCQKIIGVGEGSECILIYFVFVKSDTCRIHVNKHFIWFSRKVWKVEVYQNIFKKITVEFSLSSEISSETCQIILVFTVSQNYLMYF